MGAVPAAALDPIFYPPHQHRPLDDCCLKVDEAARLPSDPTDLNTEFTFVDADGGTPQRRVGDMLTLSQLGYSYSAGGCPAVMTVASMTGGMELAEVADIASEGAQDFAIAGPTRLERGVTSVPISVPTTARSMLAADAMPSADGRASIVIDGLAFDEAPGVVYNVYLQGDDGRREQIGVLNFFNASAPRRDQHGDHGAATFDATEAMQRLAVATGAEAALVFEPTTGLANSSIEAATEEISADSNVRFESARIEIAP